MVAQRPPCPGDNHFYPVTLSIMKFYLIIPILLLLTSCEPKAEPIRFGEDACDYCKMTIVSPQHAAEFVTEKGKVFRFDAVECLLGELKRQHQDPAILLVSDFASPGSLIQASTAIYLVSEAVPSPMGANLSAFATEQAAMNVAREKGGVLYTWAQLPEATGHLSSHDHH